MASSRPRWPTPPCRGCRDDLRSKIRVHSPVYDSENRRPFDPSRNFKHRNSESKKSKAAAIMADNYINKRVQTGVSKVGQGIGGVAYSVGNGVNAVGKGIGNSIANTTRYWGQGVAGYGNDIKDAARAGGPRVSTAGNPLGLSGVGQGKGMLPGGKLPAGTQRSTAKGSAGNPLGLR